MINCPHHTPNITANPPTIPPSKTPISSRKLFFVGVLWRIFAVILPMRKVNANGVWIVYFFGIYKVNFMDWIIENWVFIALTIVVLWVMLHFYLKKKRYNRLVDEYDEEIATQIMNGEIWKGQTTVQLIQSWGVADHEDVKVLKTKKKEIWKYDKIGKNRYRKTVTIEDYVVVGWEIK